MKQLQLTDVRIIDDSVQFTAIIRGGWRSALAELMDDLFTNKIYSYEVKGNELTVRVRA